MEFDHRINSWTRLLRIMDLANYMESILCLHAYSNWKICKILAYYMYQSLCLLNIIQVFSAYLTQNKSESPRQRFLTPTLVMAVLEAFRLTRWSPLIPMAAKRRSNETWQTMWCKYVLTIKPYVVHQRSLNIYVSQGLEVLEKVGEVIGGHVGVVPDCNMLQCGCTPRNFKSIFKDISLLDTFSLMQVKY